MYKMDNCREIVGNTLVKMFAKNFPHGLESVSEDQLLDWDLWPVCIDIHRKFAMKVEAVNILACRLYIIRNSNAYICT